MYFIEKNNLSDLKIIPSLFEERSIHMAVMKRDEPLVSIIDNALESFSEEEKAELRHDFFNVSLKTGIPRKYIRLFSIGIIFLGANIIYVIFWNQTLQKEIKARKKAEN